MKVVNGIFVQRVVSVGEGDMSPVPGIAEKKFPNHQSSKLQSQFSRGFSVVPNSISQIPICSRANMLYFENMLQEGEVLQMCANVCV